MNYLFLEKCSKSIVAALLLINSSFMYGQTTCGTPDPYPTIPGVAESDKCNDNLNFLNYHNFDIVPNDGFENIIVRVNLIFLYKDDGTGNFDFNDPDQALYVNSMLPDINSLMANIPQRDCGSCTSQPLHYSNPNIRFNFNIVRVNNTSLWNHDNDPYPYSTYANNKSYLKDIHDLASLSPNYKSGIDAIYTVSQTNYNHYFLNNGNNPPPHNSYDGQWYADFPTDNLSVQPLIHCPDMYIDWKRNVPPLGGWTGDQRQRHLRSLLHEIGHHMGLYHVSCYLNIMKNADGFTRDNFNGCQMREAIKTFMAKNIRNYVECTNVIDHNVIINNNETWSKDVKLYGDLIVKQGKTLTLTCRLELQKNAKIIVERGGELVIDGALLTACDDKWQGIVVEGNDLDQSGAGKVTLTNNAVIEFAKIGISMNPSHIPWPALANSWGGLVEATNSTIRNCERAVEFMQMDDDHSFFHGCTFSNLKDGVTLWDNENVDFIGCTFSGIQNSAILAYDSRIDAYNNTITGCKDGIEVVSTIGTTYASNIISNTINTSRDGVYAMTQNDASELQLEWNNIYSNTSGITVEGMSSYFFDHNNIVGSQFATRFWASGGDINYVTNNTFSSADWGNLANYENGPEFKDNCYGGNGKDLEVNSGSIYGEQGDRFTVAGNCFTKGSTPAITAINNVPFIYWIVPVEVPTCRTPQDYMNPIGYSIDYGQNENALTCVQPTIIKYRKCPLPKTKAEGDKMEADILGEIKKLEDDKDMNPELKKYLINRYKACLNKIRREIIIIIKEDDGTKGRTQASKDAANFAKNTGDLSLQTIGFGILANERLYDEAQIYLNTLPSNGDADVIDFITTQQINMGYLLNKGSYILSPENRGKLLELGNKTTSVSGFARSLYYKLTGERLPITFIHSERSLEPRSNNSSTTISNIMSYPNPVSGDTYYVSISERSEQTTYQIKIYNTQGSLMRSFDVTGNGQHNVDISTLNTGMYLLSIEASGMNVYNSKFVKF